MQILSSITRFLQILFSVVVLGLSISLAKHQKYGKVPTQTSYAAFTGALGIIASVIGIVSLFVDRLRGVFTWVLDGVTCIALLAAGVAFSVALKGVDCNNTSTDGPTWDNPIISGGCYKDGDTKWCADKYKVHSRCVTAEADAAFMFLAFLACIGVLVVSFLTRRN
ncbi:hypothetical protein PMG11_02195 [Penicillium brasilianum]|uniref:MARVEL domain-containing protein n=1 Tax=Penicillium brasilianum TaxID=104259 RepID=A0A0F7TLX4_PENBI|nr:hypothetical protein PMG11_02195 [Penicillium brasilianum]